jgi:hypothetical protein
MANLKPVLTPQIALLSCFARRIKSAPAGSFYRVDGGLFETAFVINRIVNLAGIYLQLKLPPARG